MKEKDIPKCAPRGRRNAGPIKLFLILSCSIATGLFVGIFAALG